MTGWPSDPLHRIYEPHHPCAPEVSAVLAINVARLRIGTPILLPRRQLLAWRSIDRPSRVQSCAHLEAPSTGKVA